jgi:hypothetical protein
MLQIQKIIFAKNHFCKKSGACFIIAKVQTHPGSSKIGKSLRKIKNIPPKVSAMKCELICVSQGDYYLCGMLFPTFYFAFRYPLQKNPVSALQKMEKAHLMGRNENWPPLHSSPS